MTKPTFVQWQAFIGPLWKPKNQAAAWNWASPTDLDITGAGTLTNTLASGSTSVTFTGIGLPAVGGAWLGPNGSGQGWEYVGYTSSSGTLAGLIRESTDTREHNGVHSDGAAVRLWTPLDMNDGKIHLVWETNQNLNATLWTADIGGVAAPRALMRRHHALLINVRYADTAAWSPYLLGWIQEYNIEDDYQRYAKWKLKIVSIAGMLEQVALKPLRSGDLDILQFGKIVKQDEPVASHYKERQSGDFTAAEPDLRAQSAIDNNDSTPWIAERFTGAPGDLSEDSFNEGPSSVRDLFGQFFISAAYITIPTGQGKGYRWLRLQPTFGPSIGSGYICNKNGPLSTIMAVNGSATHLSRIIICENLTLFSANNPLCEPTRIVEIGTAAFDLIDTSGDCLAFYSGDAWKGEAIKWGPDVNVRPLYQGDYGTSMTGPCLTAPLPGQTIRYHYAGTGYQPYQHFFTDYADMAGYEPGGTGMDPWFLMQLPGMGLLLKANLSSSFTGTLELWDGKTTHTNGLPASGTVQIGGEQISYTNKTAISIALTTRGANGTTAAVHDAMDPVYIIDAGQATDAFLLKQLILRTRSGGTYPTYFKLYAGRMTIEPRHPVVDDEDPNHEYALDYKLLATVENNASYTYTLNMSPSERITWLLISISRMSTFPWPGRARLHTVEGWLDTTLLDTDQWMDDTATTYHAFVRLLGNAGIPDLALSIASGIGSTAPLKLTTAKGFAWEILVDLADYTSTFIEVSLLSHITIRDNTLWRTEVAGSQTPTVAWTRTNAISIQFLAERTNPIAQLQLNWMLPSGEAGGSIVYPASLSSIGEIQTLNDAMYPDETKAYEAIARRYLLAKYPFSIGIESAAGDDSLKPGEFHTLTWPFADSTAVRTGFVRDVEHTIERMTWKSAVRLIQIREEL